MKRLSRYKYFLIGCVLLVCFTSISCLFISGEVLNKILPTEKEQVQSDFEDELEILMGEVDRIENTVKNIIEDEEVEEERYYQALTQYGTEMYEVSSLARQILENDEYQKHSVFNDIEADLEIIANYHTEISQPIENRDDKLIYEKEEEFVKHYNNIAEYWNKNVAGFK